MGLLASDAEEAERIARTLERPELPPNIQVRAGIGFAPFPRTVAALVAIAGWLLISAAVGHHFGWWLFYVGAGLGCLLGAGGYGCARVVVGLLAAAEVYFGGDKPETVEGSTEPAEKRQRRWFVRV